MYASKEKRHEYYVKYYSENKRLYADRNERNRAKRMALMRSCKDKPCTDCGVKYPYYVMQFDHLRDKGFNLSRSHNVGLDRILEEIKKCDVVCANCHFERTHQRESSQRRMRTEIS